MAQRLLVFVPFRVSFFHLRRTLDSPCRSASCVRYFSTAYLLLLPYTDSQPRIIRCAGPLGRVLLESKRRWNDIRHIHAPTLIHDNGYVIETFTRKLSVGRLNCTKASRNVEWTTVTTFPLYFRANFLLTKKNYDSCYPVACIPSRAVSEFVGGEGDETVDPPSPSSQDPGAA